jgi:hypothetical protein
MHLCGGVDENQFNPGSSSIPITHNQIRKKEKTIFRIERVGLS